MDYGLELIVAVFTSVLASSGLWAFLTSRSDKKDAKTQMLLGLGHDRIVFLGMEYVDRGWLTQDEYENLNDYLYIPYKKMGGDGSADRVMEEVKRLPIKKHHTPREEEIQNER